MDGDDNGINCEHIYPQSKGAGEGNARSDKHHLVPARWAVNEGRSNYPFAEVPDSETDHWYRLSEDIGSIPTNNIDEYSERLNGSFGPGKFEPKESVKGDIARSVFYFYTMYKDQADSEDPEFFINMLPTLIDWHHQDPASEDEIRITNHKASYQEDKPNPYVLDCTLATRAYGGQANCQTVSSQNFDYRPKGYVYPNPVHDSFSMYGMRGDADEVRIFNIEGQQIQSFTNILSWEVDVSGYMAGEYVLKLYCEGKIIDSTRFIKINN